MCVLARASVFVHNYVCMPVRWNVLNMFFKAFSGIVNITLSNKRQGLILR